MKGEKMIAYAELIIALIAGLIAWIIGCNLERIWHVLCSVFLLTLALFAMLSLGVLRAFINIGLAISKKLVRLIDFCFEKEDSQYQGEEL